MQVHARARPSAAQAHGSTVARPLTAAPTRVEGRNARRVRSSKKTLQQKTGAHKKHLIWSVSYEVADATPKTAAAQGVRRSMSRARPCGARLGCCGRYCIAATCRHANHEALSHLPGPPGPSLGPELPRPPSIRKSGGPLYIKTYYTEVPQAARHAAALHMLRARLATSPQPFPPATPVQPQLQLQFAGSCRTVPHC